MHNLKLLVIEFDTFDCSIIFQGCSIQIPTQGDKLTFRFIFSEIITCCPKQGVLQEMLALLPFLACGQNSWGLCFSEPPTTCHMLLKTFQNEFLFVFSLSSLLISASLNFHVNKIVKILPDYSFRSHLIPILNHFFRLWLIPNEAASSPEERMTLAS